MKRAKRIAILLLAMVLFVIVIPIIINETYKYGALHGGYVTEWDAADVLSYYGMLLGTATTAIALIGTIQFTRKQIQRNQFLENNRRKWEKVESIITQALLDVSPLNMLNDCAMDMNISPIANLHAIISKLQSYAATAKTSLDMISCYIDPVEYTYVADYVKELHNAIQQFCEIEYALESQYANLRIISMANGGNIPDAAILYCSNQTSEIIKKIPVAHDETYRRLLNMKREVFNKIYADIEIQANQILGFWTKRGNDNANT